jgi:hypothetical protein
MSALPSVRTAALAAQLKALEAQLSPAPVRAPRLIDGPPAPEEPTVVLPLRVALEAQTALYQYAAQLEQAARQATGDSNDLAGAWYAASSASTALEALKPLVEAARQENRRRWAEHKAEWDRLRRESNAPKGKEA